MELPITIEIIKKGKWYVAKALELDFVSQGRTAEEAKKNLFEVMEIQFEEMQKMGTLKDYLEECGYMIDKKMEYCPEFVSLERTEIILPCR
ncbi:MAG: type II toxin-antitoxin system HicB family antitoxin [Candidatus Desulfofervidaceae bacterium]|nr:type II toxin-antitoxin system HicB family antitoxin [Candidatus Desulfofervidaceae bacterium]